METSALMIFVYAAMTALATENALFARALGLDRQIVFMKGPKAGMLYGAVFTWMALLTALPVSLANYFLTDTRYVMIVRAPIYMLCVLLAYFATVLCAERLTPRLFRTIRPVLPFCTFNTALFGALYITSQNANFFRTLGYILGTGVGYTLALIIIYYARKRLAISPVPRAFRGLPILLVYLGFLSLAIYGLIGHGLPT